MLVEFWGWETRAGPPPAPTPCQLTINSRPATVYFRQCGIVSSHYSGANSLLTPTLATQLWWCRVRHDEGKVWEELARGRRGVRTRMSQPIHLSPPCHRHRHRSADEDAEVTSVKSLFRAVAQGGSATWGAQAAWEMGTVEVGDSFPSCANL